jgi:hypothetical protein
MGKLILNISIYVFTKNNHKIVVQTNSNFFAEKLGKLPKFALIALTPQFFQGALLRRDRVDQHGRGDD